MSASSFPVPPLDRLPSGRHRLTREAVQESQRGRLLFAVVQGVSEKGYGATTVADIVERASVSRTTFYEQFPDKEMCFLQAFNFGVEFVLGQMREAWEALDGDRGWRAHVRRSNATRPLDSTCEHSPRRLPPKAPSRTTTSLLPSALRGC